MSDEILDDEYLEAMTLADDIEREFVGQPGPVLYLLDKARGEAIDALSRLITIPATNVEQIMHAQNEVKRFRDLVSWLREALSSGNEAWAHVKDSQPELLERFQEERYVENDA